MTKTLRQQYGVVSLVEGATDPAVIAKMAEPWRYRGEGDKYKHLPQVGMPERTSDQCLLVGRTQLDMIQCESWGKWNKERLQQQGYADSTHRVTGYENFPGDVITSHTIKYGALIAVTCEVKEREIVSACKYPGKIWVYPDAVRVGTQPWGKKGIRVFDQGGCSPELLKDSGAVMLWAAWRMGYKRIYTIGLDFRKRPAIYPWTVKLIHLFILPDGVALFKSDHNSVMKVPIVFPPGLKKGRS